MDRRKALKNMGLSLGYAVATPTLISIMQSCQEEPVLEWTPDFFSKEEGSVITHLVDIILPKTDTPAASEVQVNLFIDKFIKEVVPKEEQEFSKMTMGKFIEKALKDAGKEKAMNLSAEDLEPVLAEALNVTKEQEALHQEAMGVYMEALAQGNTAELSDEVARYSFASSLRGMTIWGYKTSEYVGQKVLAYDPVPGVYIPCGEVTELTQGKAWSL